MKKQNFYHSLYIDPKGLHWAMLAPAKTGVKAVYKSSQTFAQIFGELAVAGQTLAVDPIAAAQGGSSIVTWLKSSQVKSAVADFLKQNPTKIKTIGVCLSEAFSVFRFFSMPKVEKIYWKKAIPIEARKYIPFPLDQCFFDWRAVELNVEGKTILGVLFGAARKELFEAVEDLVKSLGFEIIFVDSLPFAIARTIGHLGFVSEPPIEILKQTILSVYLDLEQVQLILLHRGIPVLSRSIYLTETPVRGSFLMERRKLDLQATIDFVNRQLGIKQLERIVLVGAAGLDEESLKNWANGLSEELGLKVERLKSLDAKISLGENNQNFIVESWPELASLGLALRGVSSNLQAHEINLAAPALETPPKKLALKKIWASVAGLSLAALAWSSWRFVGSQAAENQVQQARAQVDAQFPQAQGKDAATLKALIDAKTSSIKALRFFADPKNRLFVTPVLALLSDSIPREAWLESVDFSTPRAEQAYLVSNRMMGGWTIRGRVEVLGGQKEFSVAQDFYNALKENSLLGKNFAKANMSTKKETQSAPGIMGEVVTAKQTLGFDMEFKSGAQDQR